MATTAPRKSVARTVKRGPGSDEDFTFESSAGDITVPSLAKAPKPNAWAMLELEAIENVRVYNARLMMLMLEIGSGDAFPLIKQLSMEEMTAFMEAWSEHSGVQVGEYRAS